MVLAFTLRSLTSTLLPVRTIGIPSQTRTRSPSKGVESAIGGEKAICKVKNAECPLRSKEKEEEEKTYGASWGRSCR